MLGEAINAEQGVRLNHEGEALLREEDPPSPPEIHQSWSRSWGAVERVPRKEIDNSGVYPIKKWAWGRSGKREPDKLRRCDGKVFLHATVGSSYSALAGIVRHTKSFLTEPDRRAD
jgi:hypothetical protein